MRALALSLRAKENAYSVRCMLLLRCDLLCSPLQMHTGAFKSSSQRPDSRSGSIFCMELQRIANSQSASPSLIHLQLSQFHPLSPAYSLTAIVAHPPNPAQQLRSAHTSHMVIHIHIHIRIHLRIRTHIHDHRLSVSQHLQLSYSISS